MFAAMASRVVSAAGCAIADPESALNRKIVMKGNS